jgi:hypothetical protein
VVPAIAVAVALGLSAVGCAGEGDTSPAPTVAADGLRALDDAIAAINVSRRDLLADAAIVVGGASAVDAGDRAALAGDRTSAGAGRAAQDRAGAAATAAVRRLPTRVRGFETAVRALEAATRAPGLDDAQRDAVRAVARAARAELVASQGFTDAAVAGWPVYTAVDAHQRTWLTRARAGWYRNQQESGDAYAVLVADDRPRLDAARAALGSADAARTAAVGATSAAITAARQALRPLRTGGSVPPTG